MPEALLEMAKDLTLALIEVGHVPPEGMQDTLQKTYATLTALKAQEETGTTTAPPAAGAAPVDWKKSITRHAVICLECGQSSKQLTNRHLMTHGLDVRSYQAKYGMPRTQPLSARATSARRRQIAQQIRPWEKTPRFIQAHKHHGHDAPEPKAKARPDETEAPAAAASAQPKQQRKTTPKKKTAGQKAAQK